MRLDFSDFVAFDFETTGFGSEAKITEIGAVKVNNKKFVSKYTRLVNPGKPIPLNVQQLTGITDRMVANKPMIQDILPEFLSYIDGYPLIAHNAGFDCSFLYREIANQGLFIRNPVADTLKLARKVWAGLPSYQLSSLTERFQIEQVSAHRAWCDAEATARLYILMSEQIQKGESNTCHFQC